MGTFGALTSCDQASPAAATPIAPPTASATPRGNFDVLSFDCHQLVFVFFAVSLASFERGVASRRAAPLGAGVESPDPRPALGMVAMLAGAGVDRLMREMRRTDARAESGAWGTSASASSATLA